MQCYRSGGVMAYEKFYDPDEQSCSKKSGSLAIIPQVSSEQLRNRLRYWSGVFSHLECIQRNSLFSSNPQEHESVIGSMNALRMSHLSPEHQHRIGRHLRS